CARPALRSRAAAAGIRAHARRALHAGHDVRLAVPALWPRGLARQQCAERAGLLPLRTLLPAAHAGRAGRGRGRAGATRPRRGCGAPGAARTRGARPAAGAIRDPAARRDRRTLSGARALPARLPREPLQARRPAHPEVAMRRLLARLRTASWLGWQVEANWADPVLFTIYAVLRPLATALI